jgi:hypothetical protein
MLRLGFVALAIALGALFVAAVYASGRRTGVASGTASQQALVAAALTAAWLALTCLAASRGMLRWSPPTIAPVLLATFAIAIGVGLSPLGRRMATGIPIAALVGFQSFRILVELLLHRAYVEGLMPVQMSYSGRNFDILSGITALALSAWLASGRRSRTIVALWNLLGVALLANILAIAVLSAPTPIRVFMNEPANVWITRAPWVWLPAAMVLAAVLGLVLVFRWLRLQPR